MMSVAWLMTHNFIILIKAVVIIMNHSSFQIWLTLCTVKFHISILIIKLGVLPKIAFNKSLFIEIVSSSKSSIVGVISRPNTAPKGDVDAFSSILQDIMDILNNEHKYCVIRGKMNVDLFKFGSHPKTDEYLESLFCMVSYQ